MAWVFMLLIQATSAVVGPAGARDFNLDDVPFEGKAPRITGSSDECGARDADEIVVCGYRRSSQHLQALPSDYKERPLIAETSLVEGVTGKLSVESTEFIPGVKSNRVMITITKPF